MSNAGYIELSFRIFDLQKVKEILGLDEDSEQYIRDEEGNAFTIELLDNDFLENNKGPRSFVDNKIPFHYYCGGADDCSPTLGVCDLTASAEVSSDIDHNVVVRALPNGKFNENDLTDIEVYFLIFRRVIDIFGWKPEAWGY